MGRRDDNPIDWKHEAAVERFVEAAREADARRVEEVERLYPVLTERELAARRAREVGFTDQCMDTGVLTQADRSRPPVYLVADLFGRRVAAPSFS